MSRRLAGLELRQIDQQILERCQWKDMVAKFTGNTSAYLEFGFGVAFLSSDDVVAEAHAALPARGHNEIGVIVTKDYYRQGLGAAICAHLIRGARDRGWTPMWSCETENTASLALARKLGFSAERRFPVHVYLPTQTDAG